MSKQMGGVGAGSADNNKCIWNNYLSMIDVLLFFELLRFWSSCARVVSWH